MYLLKSEECFFLDAIIYELSTGKSCPIICVQYLKSFSNFVKPISVFSTFEIRFFIVSVLNHSKKDLKSSFQDCIISVRYLITCQLFCEKTFLEKMCKYVLATKMNFTRNKLVKVHSLCKAFVKGVIDQEKQSQPTQATHAKWVLVFSCRLSEK